ncbi:MAG TPA: phosphoribosylformylglycinamidine synthase subunit PurS [Ktedonobacterales bacterium]|jgi:phosphoribosylformylglycinamidine synthase PurS subunit|nr:phosphoribosylformylglycinamidine synthase subunit PurS [Ktedonobacterales bacterium]
MAETADTAADQRAPDTTTPAHWLARIHVTLKPVVLDPQGDAVLDGLHQLGFTGVAAVRVGKYLEVTLASTSQADAETAVRQMCERLLANPVIERYTFDVTPSR